MIRAKTMLTALPFASALDTNGFTLKSKAGTVLDELFRLSVPPVDLTKTQEILKAATFDVETSLQNEAFAVDYTTSDSDNIISQHSLALDGYVKDIAKMVASHISHAKNVVRPLVLEFAEKLALHIENKRPRDPSEDYNIVVLQTPSLLLDESFLDTLTPYKEKSLLTPDSNIGLSVKTNDELMSMVNLGYSSVDKLITEWLSGLPEGFLEHVWNVFFTKSNAGVVTGNRFNGVWTYEEIHALNAFERANYALAIFLLSNNAINNVQESSLTIAAYKYNLEQYVSYSGSLLVSALKNISLHARTNTLVINTNPAHKEIKVNGDLYKNWIATGGSPETILGVLVSESGDRTITTIDGKSSELNRAWVSYCSFYRTKENNSYFDQLKFFVQSELLNTMCNLDETEKDYVAKYPSYTERVRILLDEKLNDLKVKDFENVYQIALDFVAGVRFYYTASHQILCDINEAARVNPNIDVREAATIAAINYVSDYTADQILATKD